MVCLLQTRKAEDRIMIVVVQVFFQVCAHNCFTNHHPRLAFDCEAMFEQSGHHNLNYDLGI